MTTDISNKTDRLHRSRVRRVVIAGLALMMLGVGAWVARWATVAPLVGNLAGINLYVAEPGERPGQESQNLVSMDAYWQTRITYPTGHFDRKWIDAAAAQDRLNIRAGVPAGQVTYNRGNALSPLSLDPTRWTSIGPQPQESDTCQAPCFAFGRVSGRV